MMTHTLNYSITLPIALLHFILYTVPHLNIIGVTGLSVLLLYVVAHVV